MASTGSSGRSSGAGVTPSPRSTSSAARLFASVRRCRGARPGSRGSSSMAVSSKLDRRKPTRRPARSDSASQSNGASKTVLSRPSGPRIASNTSAQSSAERHSGPILSMVQLSAIAPWRLTRPNVGRRPVTPLRVAGEMIEPRVSVPSAKPTSPAAVAAPEPADDPLAPCSGFQGFRVRPPNQRSPDARAPIDSLATRTAPAAVSRAYTVASASMVCRR